MTLEERVRAMLGSLVLDNLSLQTLLEQAHAQAKASEGAKEKAAQGESSGS